MKTWLATLLLPLCACASAPAHTALLQAGSGIEVSVAEVAEALAAAEPDVIFIGELHMSDEAHGLIAELARALDDRTDGISLSMEMFERDVQDVLDDYVGGRIEEAAFLAGARPWKNYGDHYRPLIELARERGRDVIAANAPQNLVSRVGVDGPDANDSLFAARDLDLSEGAYKERFRDVMQRLSLGESDAHVVDDEGIERMYAAQVLRDETMAESIARYLAEPSAQRPLVHLTGRFHSDYGQGTVERLLRRSPNLRIAVLSMAEGRDALEAALDPERPAQWIIRAP